MFPTALTHFRGERAHIEPVSSNTPEGHFKQQEACSQYCPSSLMGISIKNKALKTLLGEQYLFEFHFGSAAMPQESSGLGHER